MPWQVTAVTFLLILYVLVGGLLSFMFGIELPLVDELTRMLSGMADRST